LDRQPTFATGNDRTHNGRSFLLMWSARFAP